MVTFFKQGTSSADNSKEVKDKMKLFTFESFFNEIILNYGPVHCFVVVVVAMVVVVVGVGLAVVNFLG